MPSAVHSSSFMSQLHYSSASLINSHDSITATKGTVKVGRFLVPLGNSQERLRTSMLEIGTRKETSALVRALRALSHSFN